MSKPNYTTIVNHVQGIMRSLDGKKTYSKRDVIDAANAYFLDKYPEFNTNAFVLNCCSKMNND